MALVKSALQFIFSDNRFPHIITQELGRITLEITIINAQERLIVQFPEKYINNIEIEKEGTPAH
jgi:AMMECR1 domain-containing protein